MVESLIQFGFSAGVFAPALFHRSDLKKYALGLAEGRNFIIDYLGGAVTRPGLEFIDYLDDSALPGRLVPFQFNLALGNTYVVVFSEGKIRFMQNGAYVLEAPKAVSTFAFTFTSVGHGFSVGDWLRVGSYTLEVFAVPSADTFTCVTIDGTSFDTTGLTITSVSRIYTLASPYLSADLPALSFDQDKDVIYINSTAHPERKLQRLGATNWLLTATPFIPYSGGPASVTLTPSAVGTAGIAYAVTAVDVDGHEAPIKASALVLTETTINFTTTAGSMKITWPAVASAISYRVYRGLMHTTGADVDFGPGLGFLGETKATSFVDNNYLVDFTQSPLVPENPFANGTITSVTVTAPGTGYGKASATISISGGAGSGFEGKPIVNAAGEITGVLILNPGQNYTSPVVAFGGAGGSGATGTATTSPASGNNPAAGASIQQRRVRVGTLNNPLGIWGSRLGEPDNYSTTESSVATDPYSLTLDAKSSTPIKHILESQDGFFLFCDTGIWQVRGTDDSAVSGTTAKSVPQTEEGCGQLRPLKIDREYVYLHINRRSVHSLRPSNLPTYFTTVDTSIFSSHYFPLGNEIVSWAWAKSPYKVIWAVRKNGTLLSHTFVPEQEVAAWSDHTADGFFEDVCVVKENYTDRAYFLVRRNGKRLICRMALGEDATIDETFSVDFGLQTQMIYPAADISIPATTGIFNITSATPIFSIDDVGKVLRAGGGKATVTQFFNPSEIEVQVFRDLIEPIPDLTSVRVFPSGSWSLLPMVSTLSGLDHLEGELVEVLADGKELEKHLVTNGTIILTDPASFVTAGIGFSARLKTLPAASDQAIIGNRKKAPKAVAIRLYRSRGLLFGDGEGDSMYPLTQDYETLTTGIVETTGRFEQTLDGSLVIEKRGPLASQILGYIVEMEL